MHPKRTWLLRIISISCGLIIIGIIELFLSFMPNASVPPLVITLLQKDRVAVRSINPLYPETYFKQRDHGQRLTTGRMTPRPFIVPSDQPIYRVVLVGASTVQGFPHPQRLAAAAFLEEMLQDALPQHNVQVFNLGITSIASFGVVKTLRAAMELTPNIIIAYTGHNEFYGIYGSKTESTRLYNQLHYNMLQWRIPRLLDKLINLLRPTVAPTKTLLEILGKRGQIPLSSPQRQIAEADLNANLHDLITQCQSNSIPLVLCTLASNNTGFAPAASATPQLNTNSLSQWQTYLVAGEKALLNDPITRDHATIGLKNLDQANALWQDSAWLWYLKGRAFNHLGQYKNAYTAFIRARDLDTMPWRAPSGHNEIIRRVAKTSNVYLSDIENAFIQASPQQGIGWELMSDHVHPSLAGQVLIARSLFTTVKPLLSRQKLQVHKIRTNQAYRLLLGDLPVEHALLQRTIATMLSKPPLSRYNSHNAQHFKETATSAWKNLSAAEKRGMEEWLNAPAKIPLVLPVADQLFTAGSYTQARAHYAAARRQSPFTLRGDLWAAVRWAWTLQLQRKPLTARQKRTLATALQHADFLGQDKLPAESTPILNYIRGQLHYFLQDHENALPYLEAAFHVKAFRQQFMDTLFPVLAAELFFVDRSEEAYRLAQLASIEDNGNPYYLQLVEILAKNTPSNTLSNPKK